MNMVLVHEFVLSACESHAECKTGFENKLKVISIDINICNNIIMSTNDSIQVLNMT